MIVLRTRLRVRVGKRMTSLEHTLNLPLSPSKGVTTLGGSESHLCVVIGLGQLTHQSWHKGVSSLPSVWLRPKSKISVVWRTCKRWHPNGYALIRTSGGPRSFLIGFSTMIHAIRLLSQMHVEWCVVQHSKCWTLILTLGLSMVFIDVGTIRGNILPRNYCFVSNYSATYGECSLNPCMLSSVETKL